MPEKKGSELDSKRTMKDNTQKHMTLDIKSVIAPQQTAHGALTLFGDQPKKCSLLRD